MQDTEELFRVLKLGRLKSPRSAVRYWSLVPNVRGMERALECGATHIAVFTAATESFARRNIGMSIRDSLLEFKKIIAMAEKSTQVRGYVSTSFGCPFEGRVKPTKTLRVIEKLLDLGVCQVSVGDTIGVATPADIEAVFKPAIREFGTVKIAAHFHDTRGAALANALRALDLGVRTFDSSAGGLGGCPFAPGATGNLATEDLVYLLRGMGFASNVDLDKLCDASLRLARVMKRPLTSRYLAAYQARGCQS